MEVSVQQGHVKGYHEMKSLERKLGGSCQPETQATKLLDVVEVDLLANCPAAVMELIDCFRTGTTVSPKQSPTGEGQKSAPRRRCWTK